MIQRDRHGVEVAVEEHVADRKPVDAAVAARFGRGDILVNNAAWNIGIPFPDLELLDRDMWDRVRTRMALRLPDAVAAGAPTSGARQGRQR